MPATFATLCELDARLERAGHHPLTPWWHDRLREFYAHPTARALIARVGRGGAKSHTSVKIGLNETLYGDWKVPPGEVHFWCQVSENRSEASERLRLYESCLNALGVAFEKSDGVIIIPSLRRGIRVLACQIGAVSGFRSFGYSADEAAKWENADHSANPAREVCASLDAMTVTHPGARSLIISSPLSVLDLHYELFEQGTNEHQFTCYAESWVANVSISQAQCWKLAKGDLRIFDREYRAIPQAGLSAVFDAPDIERSIRTQPVGTWARPIVTIDPSGFGRDAFMAGAWAWCTPEQTLPYPITVHELGEWTGPNTFESRKEYRSWKPGGLYDVVDAPAPTPSQLCLFAIKEFDPRNVEFGELVNALAAFTHSVGAHIVFSDQYQAHSLDGPLRKQGLRFEYESWNNTLKADAALRIRALMRGGQMCLPANTELKNQLLQYSAKAKRTGIIRLEGKGATPDDMVSLLLGVCIAETHNLVDGSPTHRSGHRVEVPGP